MEPRTPRLALAGWAILLAATQAPAGDDGGFPRVAPLEPAEAVMSFEALEGFRMDLLAAEPMVTDPVALAYDEDARAYVVEMSDYPYTDKSTHQPWKENTTDLPIGRVRLLEDTDGDGVFDRSTIFTEKLSWPTGVAVWKGGVFVTATPDIWYLKDTDGDGNADVKRRVFTGFRKFNVQAVINNPLYGPDHLIYVAGGSNGGSVTRPDAPDAPPVPLSYSDFRFDPDTLTIEAIPGGQRFGQAFDDFGRRFICNIRNPVIHAVIEGRYLARNPHLSVRSALHDVAESGDTMPVYPLSPPEPWRAARAERWAADTGQRATPRSELRASGYFTSTSGIALYRGSGYGERYRGQFFVNEVANNIVHRQALEPDGVTFTSHRIDERTEFVRSRDNWFRPVNLVHAPDGTLHVLDMYRETIEHPWSIPDDIRQRLDLESGRDRGRIYRLAPPGFKAQPPEKLSHASTPRLVELLEHPNAWHRDTAYRLIHERGDPTAVEPLRNLLLKSREPLARLLALGSLKGLGALSDDDLLHALGDESPGVRERAIALAETRLTAAPVLGRVLALGGDPDIRVRYQAALSLGESSDPRVPAALASILRRDAGDAWVRIACLSSAAESCDRLLVELADLDATELLEELGAVVGARNKDEELARVLRAASTPPVLRGLGRGLTRARRSLRALGTLAPAARTAIETFLDGAARTTRDASAPLTDRLNAAASLAFDDPDRASPTLLALLGPQHPAELQSEGVRSLGAFGQVELPAKLLPRWATFTPTLREEVIALHFTRMPWLLALFDAMEDGRIAPSAVSAPRQAALLRHPVAEVAERAEKIFGAARTGARSEVIERYRAALKTPGDPSRGRKVYQTACMVCHRLGDEGNDIGPNLSTVAHRTPEELLVHILDPNREVAPEFAQYAVTLRDGRTLAGVIAGETSTALTLKGADGRMETLLRPDIATITALGVSLMPEGLESAIDIPSMADLITLLAGK